ncbi:MAG TPA: outer membrane lipoprotein-sorting protein [Terracidiphilus sp.]|nr:outer membrane lipoprotein-sorting protein [Terracidiphilus sp.]
MKILWAAVLALLLPTLAHGADARPVLAASRQRIEAADYRIVGHIVRVDAKGARTNFSVTVKAHWFPGVLRVLLDVTSPPPQRLRVLMELRANGQVQMKIAHQGDKEFASLPFARWTSELFGPAFSYEDLLDPQFYWPDQTMENAKYGARDCDLLTSSPGTEDRTRYSKVRTWLDHTIAFPVHEEKTLNGTGAIEEIDFIGLRHVSGVWSASQIESKLKGQNGSTLFLLERGAAKANLKATDFNAESLLKF